MSSNQPDCDFNEIEDRTNRLKATLEDANLNIKVHALLEMLDECLPICPADLLDEKIFAVVLSSACQLNLKVMNEIYADLENSAKDMDQIKMKLKICQSLLDCWRKSLECIKKFKDLSVCKIRVLISSLLDVTKATLENCKTSGQKFASCREQVAEELKILFQKSVVILKELFLILNGNVIIETQDCTHVFLQALDGVGEIASLLKTLDLNSSIDMWRNFGKFAVKHQQNFKEINCDKIVANFQQMATDITILLPSLMKQSTMKLKEKTIVYIGFLLKVLIKLYNVYKDTVPNEEVSLFIELLVQIKCHSPPILQTLNIDFATIKQFELHVTNEIDNLMEICLGNEIFVEIIFLYKEKEEKDSIGYYLVILDIIKYLSRQSYQQSRPWICGTNSILDEVLSKIDSVRTELCIGRIQLPSQSDDGKQFTLYEATLIALYSLVSQIPSSDFENLELLMVKHLLSGHIWASLASSDLWCFVSRIGSSQLCLDHVRFLISLYQKLHQRGNNIETIVIGNLISRLHSQLSDKQKDLIISEIENLDSKIRSHLVNVLFANEKIDLEKQVFSSGINLSAAYQMVCNYPTVDHWNNFMKTISDLSLVSVKWSEETAKTICELWNKVTKMISDDCRGTSLNLLSDLVETMFHVSRIQGNDVTTICSILKSILESYVHLPFDLRIKVSHYLKHNAPHFTSNDASLTQWLAKLYCSMLEDNVPVIRQEALESFDQFIQRCSNDDLICNVTKVIVSRTSVCEYVRPYITHESCIFKNEYSSLDEFLGHLVGQTVDFQEHECFPQEERKRDEKCPRLETAKMSPANLEQRVDSVCKEIEELVKFKNELSDNMIRKLKAALLKL